MQHLEVSGAVRSLKWPLSVKWLIHILEHVGHYKFTNILKTRL